MLESASSRSAWQSKLIGDGAHRNAAMTAFVVVGVLVAMTVSQFKNIEVGSFRYWLLVLSALLLPLFDLVAIIRTLLGSALLLLGFAVVAGGWHLAAGDVRAVVQLLLLVYIAAWVATDRATLNADDIGRLYLLAVGLGIVVLLFTDQNIYSLVPGRANSAVAAGRVSFFPNIAYTGLLSFAVLLVLTRDRRLARRHAVVLVMAIYFLVFSSVRATLIAAAVYLTLYFWFNRYSKAEPVRMFWTALLVAVGLNIAIWQSAKVLFLLQDNFLVSTFLLRGETGISLDRIAYQLYRPWLWEVQAKIFAASPAWMGWGVFDFSKLVVGESPPLNSSGSESLPMRLLTVYGIPALLFTSYLVVCLYRSARRDDRWACASFPAIFMLMMNWGSSFHPTDFVFVLLMLVVSRGAAGYADAGLDATAGRADLDGQTPFEHATGSPQVRSLKSAVSGGIAKYRRRLQRLGQ